MEVMGMAAKKCTDEYQITVTIPEKVLRTLYTGHPGERELAWRHVKHLVQEAVCDYYFKFLTGGKSNA
jgi:transcriptional regulator of met regulon